MKLFNVDYSKESLLQLHAASTEYFTCDHQENVCILCFVLSLYVLLRQNIYTSVIIYYEFGYYVISGIANKFIVTLENYVDLLENFLSIGPFFV